ncbi:MAG: CalY family protein, partial [Defluviitaleaceae bacterium]|nr:CalY family protein [Defluviitaleaceae bacterium]
MKKNTKKIFMAILAVVAVASLTIAGTMALLQSSDTKTNTLTIGKVQVNIDEPGWTNPNCPQTPGNPVTKDPRVTNNGTVNAFVRAKITWPKDLNGQNLFVIATGNAITTDINQWGSTSSGKFPWYQSSDGWLYYYDIVPVSQQ